MSETDKKHILISNKLHKEIKDYCLLNDIKINEFIEDILKKELTIIKYGYMPSIYAEEVGNTTQCSQQPTSEFIKNNYIATNNISEENNFKEIPSKRRLK